MPASYCQHFFLENGFTKSTLNSIGQGLPKSLWFKGSSLGYLVIGSSLIQKKGKFN